MKWDLLFCGIDYRVCTGVIPENINDVWADSRKTGKGDVFVCIKGFKTDGSCFLMDAYLCGCRAFVIDRPMQLRPLLKISKDFKDEFCTVMVSDTKRAYSLLCMNLYKKPQRSMKLIGVTGTKGKTSITSFIGQIAKSNGVSCGIIGTCGAFWNQKKYELCHTTPDAKDLYRILSLMKEDGVGLVAMEVSSQALKHYRTWGLHFDVGVFSNFSPDHIGPGEHESVQEYFYWKASMFEHCSAAVLPDLSEDEDFRRLSLKLMKKPCFYAGGKTVAIIPDSIHPVVAEKTALCQKDPPALNLTYRTNEGKTGNVCLRMCGDFCVLNFLMAANAYFSVYHKCELPFEIFPAKGRMEFICRYNEAFVFVDYAHNPDSLYNALSSLKKCCPSRLICVFGCGGNRSCLRRSGMGRVSSLLCDFVIITEDNSRYESFDDISKDILSGIEKPDSFVVIKDRAKAIRCAMGLAKPGDFVVIAGKGHENYMEKEGKKFYFSDEMEILKYAEIRGCNN